MIKTVYCRICGGSGKLMGGGMMLIDCLPCDGHGYIDLPESKDTPQKTAKIGIDRRSKSYRESVKKIKDMHPGMTEMEAQNMFDSEYEKIQ